MKALRNTFLLLLAAAALASCGGGGGGSHSAFTPTGADTINIGPASTSISTNSFTTITVSVQKNDGTAESDGTTVKTQETKTTPPKP